MLAKAGYNERFLLELIRAKSCQFDTSVEGLVYFAKNGISERVVRAILQLEQDAKHNQVPVEDLPSFAPTAQPASPVRLKTVRQRVLVPATPKALLGSDPVIIMDGKHYWAIAAGQ